MSNRRWLLLSTSLSVMAVAMAAPARSEAPVYKDAERFGAGTEIRTYEAGADVARLQKGGRPARRLTRGPGYAGSEYGLGKPAFTGLGSRPDWGRSSD